MGIAWTAMIAISVLFSFYSGTAEALAAGMFSGADEAVKLCISVCGMICLWSGLMSVLEKTGALKGLSKLLNPLFRLLYPHSVRNKESLGALTGNFAANFLGIGNAATPFGIKAADCIMKSPSSYQTREISTLIVMNTASVQLIPTTICAVRAANGSRHPFEILPAVWISSLLALFVGLFAVRVLTKRGAYEL